MQFEQGNNLPRVRSTNQSSILRMVYLCAPITRADIAKRLDLTLPTITTNISGMIAAGMVRELDSTQPADRRHGRRSHLLDIVPEARRFIGVESWFAAFWTSAASPSTMWTAWASASPAWWTARPVC